MDREVINVRERPLSTDVMAIQSYGSRTLADTLRWLLGSEPSTGSRAGAPAERRRQFAMGLQVYGTAGASSVTVARGELFQDSASILPAPGPLDSTYRLGFNRSPLVVALPAAVASAWYSLEARCVDVTVSSEIRDIMNATTHAIEATLVPKKIETRIETRWVEGSASLIPALSRGDWVPLAAVFVLTGGSIGDPTGTIIDLRPVPTFVQFDRCFEKRAAVPSVKTESTSTADLSPNVVVCVKEAWSNPAPTSLYESVRMFVGGIAGGHSVAFDPGSANFKDPSTTISANGYYYLYLAPFFGVAPSGQLPDESTQKRGVMVLSHIAPVDGFNGSVLTLPSPFSNYSVPAGEASCVAAFRRRGADGTDPTPGSADDCWVSSVASHGTYQFFGNYGGHEVPLATFSAAAAETSFTLTIPSAKIPADAKSLRVKVSTSILMGASLTSYPNLILKARNTSDAGSFTNVIASTFTTLPPWAGAADIFTSIWEFDLPIAQSGDLYITASVQFGGSFSGAQKATLIGFEV